MSLVVWLPLNGNLENKGTSDLQFTAISTNTSINASGKIGQCYGNNSFSAGGLCSNTIINLGQHQSMFCWFKFTSLNSSSSLGAGLVSQHRYSSNTGMGITIRYVSSTTGYLSVNTGTGSSRTYNTYYGTTLLQANTWYHGGYTYDGSTIKIYVNGNCEKTQAYSNMSVPADYITAFCWSMSGTSGSTVHGDYKLNGLLNDVRIYDECLSPLQVHELAQGLVLHYKLNNYNTLNNYNNTVPSSNVYTYPTFNTSTATGGWSHWGPSGGSPAYGQNTDKQYIYYKENTYSHWISEGEGTGKYYLVYQTPASPGGYRSLQCILKESNSAEIKTSGTFVWPTLNSRTGGAAANTWTSVTYLGDGFYYCLYEGVIQSEQTGTNALFGIGVSPGHKVYISVMYLENAETCTSIFNNFTTIRNDAGYGNDGIISGNIKISNITPRYSNAISMNNTNTANHIETSENFTLTDNFSVSFWVKAALATNQVIFATKQIEFGLLNSLGYVNPANAAGFSISSLFKTNDWNHICTIKNNGTFSLYINGQSATQNGGNNYYVHNSDKLYLLNRNTNNSYAANASLSDFRVYATVLSASDIQNLYETSMFVDNKGNTLPFELSENSSNYIEKTGTLNDDIIEPFITLSDGSNWQLLLFHKVDNGTRLFTSSNATYCNNYGLFSRLAYINNFTYNNKYEFYVIQDGKEFRWTQTSQPTASSIAGKTVISGYLDPVNGLAKASQSNTYIGYNAWWGACGCWTQYSTGGKTGIPGFGSHDVNGMCTDYLALYARIEKPHVFKENNSIQANEFIEH